MITLYGIPNCDSMKKARRWLDANGLDYRFHDYKKAGLSEALARAWVQELGWEAVINRRGTTWRKLDQDVRDAMDAEAAVRVMLDNPSIIRRPLLDTGTERLLGFSETEYQRLCTR